MSREAVAARQLLAVHRPQDAIQTLLPALSAAPDDAELHCLLAQANLVLGRPKDALVAASRAASLEPDDEWSHRLRSIALRLLGRHAESVSAALESVRLDPAHAATHQVLGDAYLSSGNVALAYSSAYEARRLDPGSAFVYDLLGRCLLRQKNNGEAEASFRYALQIDPSFAMAHNNLGVALQRQGKRVDAVHEFNAAAKLDPSSELARRNVFKGTESLVGGGFVFILFVTALRLASVASFSRNVNPISIGIALVFVALAVWWFVRNRPARRSRLPSTAIAYYEAERRKERPILLLRIGSVVLAILSLFFGLALQSAGLMLIGAFLAGLLFAFAPRLWQRIVRQ